MVRAITGPAHPRELAGERAAVTAFVAAHRQLSTKTSWRLSVLIQSFVAASLVTKVGITLAGLSLGGVAYAAHSGSLPDAAQDKAHDLFGSIGVPASSHASGAGHGTDAQGPDATGPAAVGLCRAYAAGAKDEHGEALDSVAFQALADAAGGQDSIASYCEALLAEAGNRGSGSPADVPTAPPTDVPADPGAPEQIPSNTSHPTGPPTDLPSGKP